MRTPTRHIAAAAVALAGALAARAALGDDSREVRKTLPLDADGTLSVETYKGTITVTGASGSEASIEARIVPDGDDAESLRRARETEVRIDGGGRSVSVKTEQSHRKTRWFGESGSEPNVHYTIRMPATARLRVEDYKSATRVSGLDSDLRLRTYKGTVDVAGQRGELDLETYKGEVAIAFAALSKPVKLETYKGEIRLRIPASSGFEVDADTGRRGDFETDFELATRTGSRGRIHGAANGGGPRISFETDKGSLRLERE
jgi:putative adhesin